jgi:hypothetical protein
MKNRLMPGYFGWIALCLILGLTNCDIINPEEPSPGILQLQPFEFQIKDGQGSAQNRITEVWVYANGNLLGAFAPPTDIYYLDEGPALFTFRPGIRNNGLADDAIVYPMFARDTITLDPGPGQAINVQPVTSYLPQAEFGLLADFELGNAFTDNRDTVAASNLVQSDTDVFEGQYAGQMVLSEQAYFIEVGHSVPMSGLPADGKPVYLEFRYKSEVEFSIGILGINLDGQSFSNFFYLVKPSEEWNMLYIELTDFIVASDLPAYKILFRSLYPSNATKAEYNIFLDNIKVVHL